MRFVSIQDTELQVPVVVQCVSCAKLLLIAVAQRKQSKNKQDPLLMSKFYIIPNGKNVLFIQAMQSLSF